MDHQRSLFDAYLCFSLELGGAGFRGVGPAKFQLAIRLRLIGPRVILRNSDIHPGHQFPQLLFLILTSVSGQSNRKVNTKRRKVKMVIVVRSLRRAELYHVFNRRFTQIRVNSRKSAANELLVVFAQYQR